jgi:putative FmdB family regulatory protein
VPTYEYRCKDCGQELEVVQSFTDDSLTTCEACGGTLRKVFGNVGIAFKGSGFYKNDSRGKPASTAAKADKADAGASSSDGGSDAGGSKTEATKTADAAPAASGAGDKATTKPAKPAKTAKTA